MANLTYPPPPDGGEDALVTLRWGNPASLDTSHPRVVRHGHPFPPGVVYEGDNLSMTALGGTVAVQVQPHSYWLDGSVRVAGLAYPIPGLEPDTWVDCVLSLSGDDPPDPPDPTPPDPPEPPDFSHLMMQVAGVATLTKDDRPVRALFKGHLEFTSLTPVVARSSWLDEPHTITVSVFRSTGDSYVIEPLVDGAEVDPDSPFLYGGIMVERRRSGRLDEATSLRWVFDAWQDNHGVWGFEFALCNDVLGGRAEAGTVSYAVEVEVDGDVVNRTDIAQHILYTSWSVVWESVPRPRLYPQFDMDFWMRAGIVPNYDISVPVKDTVALAAYSGSGGILGTGFYTPLGHAFVVQNMGQTGGRSDLGPVAAWGGFWVVTQDWRNLEVLRTTALVCGSVPWQFWDGQADQYAGCDLYPTGWIGWQSGVWQGSAITPAPEQTGWSMDLAHQPDLAYLWSIIAFHRRSMDLCAAQGFWAGISTNPGDASKGYRNGGDGLVPSSAQGRSFAWAPLRVLHAAIAAGSSQAASRLWGQVERHVEQFMQMAEADIDGAAVGYLMGAWHGGSSTQKGCICPWQDDYFASTLEAYRAAGLNVATLIRWHGRFETMTYRNFDHMHPMQYDACYDMCIADNASPTGDASPPYHPLKLWGTVEQIVQDAVRKTGIDGISAVNVNWTGDASTSKWSSADYASSGGMGLACSVDDDDPEDTALGAWCWWWLHPDYNRDWATYQRDVKNVWGIVPRIDGVLITDARMRSGDLPERVLNAIEDWADRG